MAGCGLKPLQLLALLLLCGQAAAQSCGLSITFFPPGHEDANVPAAWGQTSQAAAGNTAVDQLFTIATSGPDLSLQVQPSHYLLDSGAAVPSSCSTGSRRLLGQAGGVVVEPATMHITYNFNASSIILAAAYTGTELDTIVPRVNLTALPKQLPEGLNCMNVTVTIGALTAVVDYGGTNTSAPVQDIVLTRRVCIVLGAHNYAPAKLRVGTCDAAPALNVSSQWPLVLTGPPGSSSLMFQVVYHIAAAYNATAFNKLTSQALSPPSPAEDGETQFVKDRTFEYWVFINDTATQKQGVPLALPTTLQEGAYDVLIETALVANPSLVSLLDLPSNGTFPATDPIAPGALMYAASWYQLTVPVQYAPSQLVDFTVNENGDNTYTFEWHTYGFGIVYCELDGKAWSDTEKQVDCISPATLQLDPNHMEWNHTFSVLFKDGCGQAYRAMVTYGQWGYLVDNPNAPPSPSSSAGLYDEPVAAPSSNFTVVKPKSAAASAAPPTGYMLLTLAVGLLLLPALVL